MPQKNFPAPNTTAIPPSGTPPAPPRVPPEHCGIQVNHCKNPTCANFGVPIATTATRGRGAVNSYKIVASGAGQPAGQCNTCGEIFPLKSNLGIAEEVERMRAYLDRTIDDPSCPNDACANHGVSVGTPGLYRSYGATKAGSPRWRCSACGKTFSVAIEPTLRQRQASKNRLIFKMLIGKTPLSRIADIAEVNFPTVIHRLNFIHERCVAFASDRESHLLGLPIRRLYISVDRQDYILNWTNRLDRRNIILSAVGSVDNATNYCFGLHLNHDPAMNPTAVETESAALNDIALPSPYRRFARLWLQSDYDREIAGSPRPLSAADLSNEIDNAYAQALTRADIESPDALTRYERLPQDGMRTRLEYTLYGHFMFLRSMMGNVEKWRFFLDQDSGIRAACLAAFKNEVRGRVCDAFFVRISKDMTIDKKRKAAEAAKRRFQAEKAAHPGLSDSAIVREIFKRQLTTMIPKGKWNDRWLFHPLPTINEPEMAISHLTDYGDYDPDHLALLYAKASLHGIDSLFNRIRRRSSLLERSLHSQGNAGRIWSGYAPYRPAHATAILDILRTAHNYILVGNDKMTPAMRIGLARAPLDYGDVIHFMK